MTAVFLAACTVQDGPERASVAVCEPQAFDVESASLIEMWRLYEAEQRSAGRLRIDRKPTDADYSNADLLETFREIMFFDEAVVEAVSYRTGRRERRLEKRRDPVRYAVFGTGVTPCDRADIEEIVELVSEATGLSLIEVSSEAEIEIMLLNRRERASLAWKVRQAGAAAMANDLANGMEGLVCAAYLFPSERKPGLADYTIVIPDEVSGVLRKSCIEEEFGQAFGPSADYAGARPSIFNDDEEFALFTDHDAWLFRILYDPRLADGMSQSTAMPIVRKIIEELRPGA
ncbi:MAG: DUF2927 domain-containing protein [Pseudomonadota bacterium]